MIYICRFLYIYKYIYINDYIYAYINIYIGFLLKLKLDNVYPSCGMKMSTCFNLHGHSICDSQAFMAYIAKAWEFPPETLEG